MQLLKCIIHHADAVQKQYLVQKQLPSITAEQKLSGSIISDNMSSIFTRTDAATDEINDKCYQRWHQVLQEGLVPMSVRALGLLDKTAGKEEEEGQAREEDEEDAYYATLEGMDEEIQIMAILARAAALNDLDAGGEEPNEKHDATEDGDGMGQINAVIKCMAMLLFHIVLAASSGSSSDATDERNIDSSGRSVVDESVAGYDGRVRHVVKLACVDVLTHALVDTIESAETNDAKEEETDVGDETGPLDVDDYSLWNMANIKSFLDQTDLGKDAVFGTPFESSRGKKAALEADETEQAQRQEKGKSLATTDDQTVTSGDTSTKGPQFPEQASVSQEVPTYIVESSSAESSSSMEIQSEEVTNIDSKGVDGIDSQCKDKSRDVQAPVGTVASADGDSGQQTGDAPDVESNKQDEKSMESDTGSEDLEDEIVIELRARRRFNAKFLATRKFELIERLVAIDIVRFLIAEEREEKLREQELKERQEEPKKPIWNRKSSGREQDANDNSIKHDEDGKDSEDDNPDKDKIFTASRIQQMKRGAKIAGAGLALGTVFAITGGLAAPALAAGIGGIATLTGASTASSAAVLAVLATFKAGAALFGVGGGGLAAYKMKKRTAGLSQFEIRRENIEQYMYLGKCHKLRYSQYMTQITPT